MFPAPQNDVMECNYWHTADPLVVGQFSSEHITHWHMTHVGIITRLIGPITTGQFSDNGLSDMEVTKLFMQMKKKKKTAAKRLK